MRRRVFPPDPAWLVAVEFRLNFSSLRLFSFLFSGPNSTGKQNPAPKPKTSNKQHNTKRTKSDTTKRKQEGRNNNKEDRRVRIWRMVTHILIVLVRFCVRPVKNRFCLGPDRGMVDGLLNNVSRMNNAFVNDMWLD